MRFLTDANVFVPLVDGLRILGHDVFDIKEQKLNDLYDSEIYDKVRCYYYSYRSDLIGFTSAAFIVNVSRFWCFLKL